MAAITSAVPHPAGNGSRTVLNKVFIKALKGKGITKFEEFDIDIKRLRDEANKFGRNGKCGWQLARTTQRDARLCKHQRQPGRHHPQTLAIHQAWQTMANIPGMERWIWARKTGTEDTDSTQVQRIQQISEMGYEAAKGIATTPLVVSRTQCLTSDWNNSGDAYTAFEREQNSELGSALLYACGAGWLVRFRVMISVTYPASLME